MKISIGTNIKDGPWGGGNLFAINLRDYLLQLGHEVVTNLKDEDIDIILITEPRKTSESSAFTHVDVKNYINFINNETLVLHRINECDERKNTNFVNKYLIEANKVADYTVFVSSWLKNLYIDQGISNNNNYVILAGANKNIFNLTGRAIWNNNEKIKLVTHHWGANWNKGFAIYNLIDDMLEQNYWKERIQFTYIGNLPKNFNFKNSTHLEPLSGHDLSNELKKNHVYITGSLNEPSGNHHIEAGQCGLPIMYIDSGGVKEYTQNFGVEYNESNFEEKIIFLMKNYREIFKNMINYPFDSDQMCKEYLNLILEMVKNKDDIIKKRKIEKRNKFEKIYYLIKRYFIFISQK